MESKLDTVPGFHSRTLRTMAVLLLSVLVLGDCIWKAEATSTHTREGLLTKLLDPKVYESTIAPNFYEDTHTDVTVQLFIIRVYSISEAAMEYSMDVILRQTWVDKRLRYNDSLERLELGSASAQKVWFPDTFFYNEKKGKVHTVTTENQLIHIHKDGTVYYSARLSLTLGCSMGLHLYPLDEQFCPIILFSYAYTTANIIFRWHEGAINFEGTEELAQFDVLTDRTILSTDISEYDMTGNYSRLTAKILFARKVGHYVIQVFIPSILIVVLSWVNFWLDETAVPARVSLGVVTVLTITTMSSGIRQTLPPVSYVKAIDVWMFVCQLFVFGALLEFAFVNARSRSLRKSASTENARTQNMDVSNSTGSIQVDIEANTGHRPAELEPNSRRSLNITAVDKAEVTYVSRVDPWSRRIFPALFALFLIIFFSYVEVKSKQHPGH